MIKTISAGAYEDIFINSPAAQLIISTDAPSYTILNVNNAYLISTNSSRDTLIGRSVFAAFPANPSDEDSKNIERTIDSFQKAIVTGKSHTMSNYRYDIPVRGTDQFEERYWITTNTPILDDEGKVKYFIHSPLNVTELYKLREREKAGIEALKKQREQLYSIFMQAPVGIGIFKGPDYIVDLVNPTLCELYEKKVGELRGKPVFDVLTYARGQGFEDLMDKVRLTGIPFRGNGLPVTLFRKGKLETVYLNFVYEPFRENDGTISGIIAVATEITDLFHAKQQIEEAEERARLAVDAGGLGTFDLNLETGVMYTSDLFAHIFGFDKPVERDEYIGVIVPEDLPVREAAHLQAIRTGKLLYECRILWKDQSIHSVRIEGKVYYNEHSKAIRVLGTLLDITEQKHLQKQKDDFIGIASHELKTPVTSIKAYTQVLGKILLEKENNFEYSIIDRMESQINKLTSLIADLLDVTKMNSGKLQFNDNPFDFNQYVKSLLQDLQLTALKHLLVEDFEPTGMVCGDKDRIGQVITNLITNAIKYSPNADHIVVRIRSKNREVILSVQDFGIGISPANLEKVFEQFYRVSGQMQHTFPGLGLGLYISSEIIKRESGRIWVESVEGEGSVFCFALPLLV